MGFEIKVDDELSLRLVEPEHAEELFEVIDANREHILRWLPWVAACTDVDAERKFGESTLAGFAKREQLVVSLVADGKIVGGSGWTDWKQHVMYADTLTFSSADIGYWLAQEYTGKGLVTRAVRALTTLAIQTYGIRRLTIRAEPENKKSWMVAERLGYTYEGTMRDVNRYNGKRVDHKLYSMLAEEWTP